MAGNIGSFPRSPSLLTGAKMDSSLRTVAIFPKSLIFGLSTLPKHSLGSWRNEKMRVERYLMVSPFSFAESCNKGWVRVSKQRMSSVNILVPMLLSLPPLRESPGTRLFCLERRSRYVQLPWYLHLNKRWSGKYGRKRRLSCTRLHAGTKR